MADTLYDGLLKMNMLGFCFKTGRYIKELWSANNYCVCANMKFGIIFTGMRLSRMDALPLMNFFRFHSCIVSNALSLQTNVKILSLNIFAHGLFMFSTFYASHMVYCIVISHINISVTYIFL